jgi:hypothetical protein
MLSSASQYVNVGDLLKILGIGLVAGAGLTAVFAFGVAALSRSGYARDSGTGTGGPGVATRNAAGLTVAVLCFLIVLAGIGYGISVALTK